MKEKRKLVYVDISSWVGLSYRAEHYYAKLVWDDGEYQSKRLERSISQEEADVLNKKDDWDGWQGGALTERFNTKEEILESAKLKLEDGDVEWDVMIEGSSAYVQPQLILESNVDIDVDTLNGIYEKFDKLTWTNRGDTSEDKEKDQLLDDWYELLNKEK